MLCVGRFGGGLQWYEVGWSWFRCHQQFNNARRFFRRTRKGHNSARPTWQAGADVGTRCSRSTFQSLRSSPTGVGGG
jgi:hypothetical protein